MNAFIVINEEFDCQHCGHHNERLKGSCRNHCTSCLYSLHLDKDSPGDRNSDCLSLMAPLSVEQDGKKGWMIWHHCLKCEKKIRNKIADDDNMDKIADLSRKPQ